MQNNLCGLCVVSEHDANETGPLSPHLFACSPENCLKH